MAKPSRLPSACADQTYFITTNAEQGKFLLQSEPMAKLVIDTLYSYRKQGKFLLHEFVVMPNHLHVLITPTETIERAMQLVKGGFSFRAKKELNKNFEIWQRGFTDRRVRNVEEYNDCREYIHQNPVVARLASKPDCFPYSSAFPGFELDGLTPYLGG
jgi:putative transposase